MIRQVCLYLTAHCNLKCRYCNIVDNAKKDEMDTEQIQRALYIISKDIKPEFVVLFGGEPFVRQDIQEIVDTANTLRLDYTVITNGTVKKEVENMKGVTCSVDWVELDKVKSYDDILKSISGWNRILEWKQKPPGGPDVDVVGNCTIHMENYKKVPDVVRLLSLHGIWTVVGVLHSGKNWKFRSDCPELMLTNESAKEVAEKLLELKHEPGIKMHNADAYFEMMPTFAPELNWKCEYQKGSEYLTIFSDGRLLACNDVWGEETPKMTIFDWDEGRYQKAWRKDVTGCRGCFYNHMIQLVGSPRGEGLVHK